MPTIYELKSEQQELLDALFFEEDNEEIQKAINNIYGTVEGKLRYLSTVLLEARALEEARKEAVKKAQGRAKIAEAAVDRLKGFILQTMQDFDIKKIEGEHCSIRLDAGRESVSYAENFDQMILPDDCIELVTTTKTLGDKVKEHLKSGEEIPGVSLIKKPFILVK